MINAAKSDGTSVEKFVAALDEKNVAFLKSPGGTQLPLLWFLRVRQRKRSFEAANAKSGRFRVSRRALANGESNSFGRSRERLFNSKPAVAAADEVPKS